MPITPLHFGPAALVKSATSSYFSFMAFGLAQVLIDLEPLYYMSIDAWPIHRFFHTYPGASVVAVLVLVVGKPVCAMLVRLWNWRLSETQKCWLSINPDVSLLAMATGAFFGAWSHVFLDSIMHSDMQPLAPFANGNTLLHIISVDQLYHLCALLGVLGGTILLILLFIRKAKIEHARENKSRE